MDWTSFVVKKKKRQSVNVYVSMEKNIKAKALSHWQIHIISGKFSNFQQKYNSNEMNLCTILLWQIFLIFFNSDEFI